MEIPKLPLERQNGAAHGSPAGAGGTFNLLEAHRDGEAPASVIPAVARPGDRISAVPAVTDSGFTADHVLLAQMSRFGNDAAPAFEPTKWNARPEISNCYVYAANDYNATYTRNVTMEPGNFSDFDFDLSATSGREMRRYANYMIDGAIADGMRWTGNNANAAPGHYKVALLVAPADPNSREEAHMDYHWVRQDNDGTWSHKFGERPVSNVDVRGHRITDPRHANFGPYHFVGYFDVPAGGIDLRRSPSLPYTPQRESPKHTTMKAPPIPDGPRRW